MTITVHLCGDPSDPRLTEEWMRDIVRMEGVLGYSIISGMLRAEEERRQQDQDEDIIAKAITECQNCSGTREHECPELEFESHSEATCAYACVDGTVSCPCLAHTICAIEAEMDYEKVRFGR